MSKLVLEFQVPSDYDRSDFQDIIRAICSQVNSLSEGRISARYNARSTVPTEVGAYFAVGDFVPDSNPTIQASVAASATANYVRAGWRCIAPGSSSTAATFVEVRELTGT